MRELLKRFAPHIFICLLVSGLYQGGLLESIEAHLIDSRFRLTERPATGDLLLVEIDSASLKQLDEWPWPRRYHAALLDRLRDANAGVVAFDIDFSSRSRSEDDGLLAAAIGRMEDKVILPVFEQHATSNPANRATHVNKPIPELREKSRLGAVTVFPEANGQVRRFAFSETLHGERYLTMPAILAGTHSDASGRFIIDFAIDPDSIPRVSYADVLAGKVPAEKIRGRTILVGAVALELGEQIATPLYPVISGPELQVLAYESIMQGRVIRSINWPVILTITLILAILVGPFIARLDWRIGAGVLIGGLALIYGIALGVQAYLPVSIDVSPWLFMVTASYGVGLTSQLERFSHAAFQRRMEAENQRIVTATAVQDAVDGILILGWDNRIRLINRAAARILGIERGDVIGQSIDRYFRALDFGSAWLQGEPTDEFIARLAEVGHRIDFKTTTENGAVLDGELTVHQSILKRSSDRFERRTEDRAVYSLALRDVTDRKAFEISQRRATEAALEASHAKSQFLANMSHEIRTPLNAILGFTDIIRHGVLGPVNPPKYREYVDDIYLSAEHLSKILGDLLDLSKIESGQQELQEQIVGVREIFTECLTIAEGRMSGFDRLFTVDVDAAAAYVWADRRLLLQSILNLVINAIKYSDPKTRIWLRSYKYDDRMIAIEIEDLGWGISEEDLQSVAKPFFQAASGSSPHSGVGLGLSLVAKYTELHNGKFSIQSQLGQGTTARILLPSMVIEGGLRDAETS